MIKRLVKGNFSSEYEIAEKVNEIVDWINAFENREATCRICGRKEEVNWLLNNERICDYCVVLHKDFDKAFKVRR